MPRSSSLVAAALAVVLTAAGLLTAVPGAGAQPGEAPGGPGALSHFGLARKDCLGTARNTTSKVWFTVAGGVLSDVYAPTIDNTNVESLQFVVTDGRTFTDLQSRDTTHTVRATDASGMGCEVTSTARDGRYRLITTYVTDPARDSVVLRTRLEPLRGDGRDLAVYVRLDATINGNGGGGAHNGGGDTATVDAATTALVSADPNTATNAVNRDYAVPLAAALRADRRFLQASSGFAGTASDGLTQLDAARRLTDVHATATDGNVVQTARVDARPHRPFTLALGFGRDAAHAVQVAGESVNADFARVERDYLREWQRYDAALSRPSAEFERAYWPSVNVLKASEDKTFPGAIVASLGSPWGQAVSAGDTPDGRPVYFGSYREVFARDLYQSFSGLLAAGDVATARATVRFLFERQQLADGRFPRNSLVNGRLAPDSGGDQLDETAFPILMALQAGLDRDRALWERHVRKAADFVVAHGPAFGTERWEEQSGHSPSTIAAQIAGLVAAGVIAQRNGDAARSRVYLATADEFQRSVKGWTVTTSGPSGERHFVRLSKNGDPNSAFTYDLGNGSVDADHRAVIDAGFLELPRLGVLPAGDADVVASLAVVDRVLRRDTPTGPGWYRYGTDAPGSEDGYGDCFEPDPTDCAPTGRPWPTGNAGSGHLWPVLAGERGAHALATGDAATARALARTMIAQTSGIGLVPEQTWENAAVPPSPFGTDPALASIGFEPGGPAGSASPLTWAQGQLVRLVVSLDRGRVVEQPLDVRARYVDRTPPAELPLTITAPADVTTPETTVTGTTAPGARVDVAANAVDSGGVTVVTATAAADGSFAVTVPSPLGATVVTAAASLPVGGPGPATAATGHARATVTSDFVDGDVLLDVVDPTGDDTGPGTYAYPTAADFRPGAYDIERFQVIDAGDDVILRTRVRDLSPTFGSALGAQLLDVYAHDPAATVTSTAAPHPSRRHSIAPEDAWSRFVEVQGFRDPVFTDAAGAPLAGARVFASAATRYLTIVLPAAALGDVGPGWRFAVVLTGQDGFSPDQARGFQPTPEPYQFGVCAPGGSSPICAIDPATAPKAVDVITPPGVDQATVLDPTRQPVEVRAVPIM